MTTSVTDPSELQIYSSFYFWVDTISQILGFNDGVSLVRLLQFTFFERVSYLKYIIVMFFYLLNFNNRRSIDCGISNILTCYKR